MASENNECCSENRFCMISIIFLNLHFQITFSGYLQDQISISNTDTVSRNDKLKKFLLTKIYHYFLIYFVQTKITSFIFEKRSGIKEKHSS